MLNFTDRAREVVRTYLDQSGGELEALRITRQPGSPLSPRFELTLIGMDETSDQDREVDNPGFPVFVAEEDAELLEGATVDFVERVNQSGFEVRTVPRARPGASREGPEGEIADRVRAVLQSQVNPAIASHGGMISLVDVDGTEIFVEMSGGCQGCALSRMTLQQGVERMLREAIPEITAVHDVTDHTAGANPFFTH
ncbi:MAG: NifU family protein [Gemmatimonadota bacterium]